MTPRILSLLDRTRQTVRRALRLKERTLGTARTGRERYDLPLAGGTGTGFLILLIALMTFLAAMALSASFLLQGMGSAWRSGLEGKATVEIPATDAQGRILSEQTRAENRRAVLAFLKGAPAVAQARALEPAEITALVGPWLGEADAKGGLQGIVLPDIVALTLARDDDESVSALETRLHAITPRARLDTHRDWLADMLRATRALQTAALVLALVTGATTAASVGGAVRSRMAEHKADIEILHLMGAMDSYVVRQFQRHTAGLALRGGIAGLCGALALLLAMNALAGDGTETLLPDLSFSALQTAILLSLPVFAAGIAALAARATVSRALARMP
ncbi:MAG TPA: permease [Alphaproteobacteria bacterium]|nr:permease [Alphaproteobacteria bacterium]